MEETIALARQEGERCFSPPDLLVERMERGFIEAVIAALVEEDGLDPAWLCNGKDERGTPF